MYFYYITIILAKEYREASNLERHKKVMDQTSPQTPFNDFKILPSGEHISPSNKYLVLSTKLNINKMLY